jgi:hypothetical protein
MSAAAVGISAAMAILQNPSRVSRKMRDGWCGWKPTHDALTPKHKKAREYLCSRVSFFRTISTGTYLLTYFAISNFPFLQQRHASWVRPNDFEAMPRMFSASKKKIRYVSAVNDQPIMTTIYRRRSPLERVEII